MKIYRAMFLVLASGLIGACQTNLPTTVEKQGTEYKVTKNSLVLNSHIKVVERSTRLKNDLLEAQVRGQNVSSKDVQFEYRFIWLDKDGIRIDSEMSIWKPLALHPKEAAFMSGIAPTPEAKDFLMSIRFAQQGARWGAKEGEK